MRSFHHLEPVYHPASSLSPPSIIQALETLHGFQKAFPQLLAIAPAVSSGIFLVNLKNYVFIIEFPKKFMFLVIVVLANVNEIFFSIIVF